MGAILAKFRKEKSTTEVLEGLEEKITQLEKYTINTQEQKRRIVGNFLATSIGIYVIAFIVFYFVYFPPTWRERILYSVPLLVFPFVIYLLRRLFTWYFERKLDKNSSKLTALLAEKKKILEQVMDKETYKVAVKLLARYGDKNNGQKSLNVLTPRASSTGNLNNSSLRLSLGQSPLTSNLQDFRLRPTLSTTSLSATPRQLAGVPPATAQALLPRAPLAVTPQRRIIGGTVVAGQELRRRTPFPIVNQQGKGFMERIVDVLIGDGPKDRFAMICKECFAHNGMALKDDFEYTTFRCAFCNALNPARKARPIAPRLPEQHFSHLKRGSNSSSSSATDIDDSENDEPLASMPAQSAAATPHIHVTEANSSPSKIATLDTSNTPVMRRQPNMMGAGDGPDIATASMSEAAVDKEQMEIVDDNEEHKEAVATNLHAIHAAAAELNRLQERFAQMYTTPEDEEEQQQATGGKIDLDKQVHEEEQSAELDEFKKIK